MYINLTEHNKPRKKKQMCVKEGPTVGKKIFLTICPPISPNAPFVYINMQAAVGLLEKNNKKKAKVHSIELTT